ncbi:MAG TPA: methyltransferase domain-containing protein, partial [Thermoleophilaceae bacterium]
MLRSRRLPLFPLIVARERLTRSERAREPEPMVMDEPVGVAEYDAAGEAVQVPVHHFNALAISRLLPEGGTLVDLGCGSGRLLARLARGRPDARLIGLDLSEPMLETGRRLLEREGVADRVDLRRGDITTFDTDLAERPDVVSSNFTLHQFPEEDLVHRCLAAIGRERRSTGCGVYVFDLVRLRSAHTWPAMMASVRLPGEAFLHDSLASERAAFTFEELTGLVERAGLGDLEHIRSRPLGEYQVHRAPGRGGGAPGAW